MLIQSTPSTVSILNKALAQKRQSVNTGFHNKNVSGDPSQRILGANPTQNSHKRLTLEGLKNSKPEPAMAANDIDQDFDDAVLSTKVINEEGPTTNLKSHRSLKPIKF